MHQAAKWDIPESKQNEYIRELTKILLPLRVAVGITQDELAKAIGISRQTYSAAENGKRQMTWGTFLSLILFFDYNHVTRKALRESKAFPRAMIDPLIQSLSIDDDLAEPALKADMANALMMLKSLDSQGIHSLKTVLWVEYARCTKQSGEAVLKSFDGENLSIEPSEDHRTAQEALANIRRISDE